MISKFFVLIFTVFTLAFSFTVNAQTSFPKGKVQIIEFSNSTALFTVPAGKTWYIMNIFSDCATNIKTSTSDPAYKDYDEVRVFIKSINMYSLTDISKSKIGPVVYRGPNHERIQPMPIVLSENSTIEFLITTGNWDKIGKGEIKKNDILKAYLNYIETDN